MKRKKPKWPEYVAVNEFAARAESARLKMGATKAPTKGRKIASSFWGQAWCRNIESYADYAYRLIKARTYLRHGAVLNMEVSQGLITAKVAGSEVYDVSIKVLPMEEEAWEGIIKQHQGCALSIVDLYAGKLPAEFSEKICSNSEGLFPKPHELKSSCTCLDWADMCKHGAALLYAYGVYLDDNPSALFELRRVNPLDLIASSPSSEAPSVNLLNLFDLS